MDRASAETTGVRWWRDLIVPAGVTLTVFDLCLLPEEHATLFTQVLARTDVPDIFTHVPSGVFQELWSAVKPYAIAGGQPEAYFELSARLAARNVKFQQTLREYDRHRQAAVEVITRYLSGVKARLDAMVSRSLEQVPRLWDRY